MLNGVAHWERAASGPRQNNASTAFYSFIIGSVGVLRGPEASRSQWVYAVVRGKGLVETCPPGAVAIKPDLQALSSGADKKTLCNGFNTNIRKINAPSG